MKYTARREAAQRIIYVVYTSYFHCAFTKKANYFNGE